MGEAKMHRGCRDDVSHRLNEQCNDDRETMWYIVSTTRGTKIRNRAGYNK